MDTTSASLPRRIQTSDHEKAWEQLVEFNAPLIDHWKWLERDRFGGSGAGSFRNPGQGTSEVSVGRQTSLTRLVANDHDESSESSISLSQLFAVGH